jgi:2-polyprenyl-6-methoxyphenol hydroxylase-like FAD-dependent oxidoreductase
LSILLAKAGISVSLLEASDHLDKNPRAAHYAPSACYDLNRAGVLQDLHERGFFPDSVCWRRPDGTLIGGIRNDGVKIDYPMVCLPLDKLDQLLLEHFQRNKNSQILFEHKVVAIKQNDNSAAVEVLLSDGTKKWIEADFVVGADGANSQIRRSLFGDLNYPGETLTKQIIATNVRYDFHKFGYWDSNFIIDPENWYMAAKITKDGLWRVTYGDEWGLSNEEYLKRQPMRFEKILLGNPKPGDYELVSASPYKLHQRCAPSLREGRFMLVADAGHLCNPLQVPKTFSNLLS